MFQIRERMKALGKTQVWLILQLRERGIVVQPPGDVSNLERCQYLSESQESA